MQQIDETTYRPQTAEYWRTFPLRPCRWGMAPKPSDRIMNAFVGRLEESKQDTPVRCEDVIARRLAG
jgi:hypothetical protein